ncbi:zinc/iron permease [Pyrolobus fumarii 1A]|uniref:Zinc/iron permease n=1 Tax=Pyrolobus fumarii (strain DSM 11204 / 1A) TaxID=694429 RepID=G0EE95_PYRF1|nr:ZIP family metal transporter [Pyrolobus fumarii]AEM38789.1 zinc/iron permease [Pyrolobus fumarii 1A]
MIDMMLSDTLLVALAAGGLAALLTSVGALLGILFGLSRVKPERFLDVGLAFSAGVMIVASFTNLLMPAMEAWSAPPAILGLITGVVAMIAVHVMLPHEHTRKEAYEGPYWGRKLHVALLVSFAVVIHNFPEGLVIGAASAYDVKSGLLLGLAIGLQDIPEGIAIILPLYLSTGRAVYSLAVGMLSGLSELVMALLGATLGESSMALLPVLLGFGAGAMIFVSVREVIPESFREGHEDEATLGFFLGFIMMLLLDLTLS